MYDWIKPLTLREALKAREQNLIEATYNARTQEVVDWVNDYLKRNNERAKRCHESNLTLLAYDAHSRQIAMGHLKKFLSPEGKDDTIS